MKTSRLNDPNKVIVTVAPTGSEPTKKDNPALPTQPKAVAETVIECYKAGAAVAHIHVRDDDDNPSMAFNKFEETVNLIREAACPILLNLTSSGTQGLTYEDRVKPFMKLKPEIASFDAGTMNWRHSFVAMNEPKFLEFLGEKTLEAGVKPEIELFDMGMLYNAIYYIEKGFIKEPANFQICLGAPGGMTATPENLLYMVNHLPEKCTWGAFGIGKASVDIIMTALALGGNIRVGFEDNVYYHYRQLAESNVVFVERVKRLVTEQNKTLATPDEAREILGITKAM